MGCDEPHRLSQLKISTYSSKQRSFRRGGFTHESNRCSLTRRRQTRWQIDIGYPTSTKTPHLCAFRMPSTRSITIPTFLSKRTSITQSAKSLSSPYSKTRPKTHLKAPSIGKALKLESQHQSAWPWHTKPTLTTPYESSFPSSPKDSSRWSPTRAGLL
jgi:hypothetical protein